MKNKLTIFTLLFIFCVFCFAGIKLHNNILLYDSTKTEFSTFQRSLTGLTIDSGTGGIISLKVAGTEIAGISDEFYIQESLYVYGDGTGALADIDLHVGSSNYGIIEIGNSLFGRTNRNNVNLDLDGTVILENKSNPATSNILFAMMDSTNSMRFALPQSGVGNATYNPRSMLISGPAPNDDECVTVGYWRTTDSIFHNIDCDTSTNGADLGVQNDVEIEGDLFIDSIKESTTNSGITFSNKTIFTGVSIEVLTVTNPINGTLIGGSGSGDVVGPASATDEYICIYNGTTGKLIQNSSVDIAEVTANTAKVTNATHTGNVTGSTALTLNKTAISDRTDTVITASDYIIYGDVTDTNNLKKDTIQGILDLGSSVSTEKLIKGWITFVGTGTISISDSYNVSSITDVSTGNYRVYWDTDFANTNYCIVFGSPSTTGDIRGWAEAVGNCYVATYDSGTTATDSTAVMIIAIGDQ